MKITRDTVVSIEYTIRKQDGEVVDTSSGRQPLTYLHGYRQIVPGVESAIEGLEAGAAVDLWVGPEDAYGERDPTAILVMPRAAFPAGEPVEAGAMFRAFRPDGRPIIFSVVETAGDMVVVDANHPLAGHTLHIEVAVVGVREATDEERIHQHAHGEEPPVPQEIV